MGRHLRTSETCEYGLGLLSKIEAIRTWPALVAQAFNPSNLEAVVGESLWVWGQPGLQELVSGQAPTLQRIPVLEKKHNKNKQTNKKKKHRHLVMAEDDSGIVLWSQCS